MLPRLVSVAKAYFLRDDVSVMPIKWASDGHSASDLGTSSRVIFGANCCRHAEL
jgi:hypothetical protein